MLVTTLQSVLAIVVKIIFLLLKYIYGLISRLSQKKEKKKKKNPFFFSPV
jgi:hypothetical protein